MTALLERAAGSANLTGYGVERTLECSVLIRGGALPGGICDHITALLDTITGGPSV